MLSNKSWIRSGYFIDYDYYYGKKHEDALSMQSFTINNNNYGEKHKHALSMQSFTIDHDIYGGENGTANRFFNISLSRTSSFNIDIYG